MAIDNPEMFRFKLTITGRIRAETSPEVVDQVKRGLSLSVHLHDSVDEFLVDTWVDQSEFEQFKRRLTDG